MPRIEPKAAPVEAEDNIQNASPLAELRFKGGMLEQRMQVTYKDGTNANVWMPVPSVEAD